MNVNLIIQTHGIQIIFMILFVTAAHFVSMMKKEAGYEKYIKPFINIVMIILAAGLVAWAMPEFAKKSWFLFGLFISGAIYILMSITRKPE